MTLTAQKQQIRKVIKAGLDDTLINCSIKYGKNSNEIIGMYDSIVHVYITYGKYVVEQVELTIINGKIFSVKGAITLYQINDINKELTMVDYL